MFLFEALDLHPAFAAHTFDDDREYLNYLKQLAAAQDHLNSKYFNRIWDLRNEKNGKICSTSPENWTNNTWNNGRPYPLSTQDVVRVVVDQDRKFETKVYVPNTEEGHATAAKLKVLYKKLTGTKTKAANARRAATKLEIKMGLRLKKPKKDPNAPKKTRKKFRRP